LREESLSYSQRERRNLSPTHNEKGGVDVRFSRLPPVLLRSIYMYLD